MRSEIARIASDNRTRSYAYWQSLIDSEPLTFDIFGDSGQEYQVEIHAFWDDVRGGDIRVLFSIDDGGWRAYSPITEDFIIAPDGSFVGE